MRQLTALIVSVGVLAAPAFAQYQSQIPNLAGSWTFTVAGPDGPITARFDLAQDGTKLGGHEQIVRPDFSVVMRVVGDLTSSRTGTLRQVQVEQMHGITGFCLQPAEFRLTGPDTMSVRLVPASNRCDSTESFTLTRTRTGQGQNLTRNRAPQPNVGNSLLGLLLLGAMGGDSTPSADQQQRYDRIQADQQAKERMDDDSQRQREREATEERVRQTYEQP